MYGKYTSNIHISNVNGFNKFVIWNAALKCHFKTKTLGRLVLTKKKQHKKYIILDPLLFLHNYNKLEKYVF